ncbi:hypothetical protein HYQ46_005087 [Verticillium longisporum]|nr:hypothetical protein HYQ46_005087 [Verticillium longisporum]
MIFRETYTRTLSDFEAALKLGGWYWMKRSTIVAMNESVKSACSSRSGRAMMLTKVGKFVERMASARKSDRDPSLNASASMVFSRASSLKCSMKVDRSKSRNISSVPESMDSAIFVAWFAT